MKPIRLWFLWVSALLILALVSGCSGRAGRGTTAPTAERKGAEATVERPALVFDLWWNDGSPVPELNQTLPTATARREGSKLTVTFSGLDPVADPQNFVTGGGDGQGWFYQAWLLAGAEQEATSLGVVVPKEGKASLSCDLSQLPSQPAPEAELVLSLEPDDGVAALSPNQVLRGPCPAAGSESKLTLALPSQPEDYDCEARLVGNRVEFELSVTASAVQASSGGDEGGDGEPPQLAPAAKAPEAGPGAGEAHPGCAFHAWAYDAETKRSVHLGALQRQGPAIGKYETWKLSADPEAALSAAKVKWEDLDAIYLTWQPPLPDTPSHAVLLANTIPFAVPFNARSPEDKYALHLPSGVAYLEGAKVRIEVTNLDRINDPYNFVTGKGTGSGLFYEVWAQDTDAGSPVSLGVLPVDLQGNAIEEFPLGQLGIDPQTADLLVITLEEDDRDPLPNELEPLRGPFPTEKYRSTLAFALSADSKLYSGYARVEGSTVMLGAHLPLLPEPPPPSLCDATPYTAQKNGEAKPPKGGSYYYEGWLLDAKSGKTVSVGKLDVVPRHEGGVGKAVVTADLAVSIAATGLTPTAFDHVMVTLEPPDGAPEPSQHRLLLGAIPGREAKVQVAEAQGSPPTTQSKAAAKDSGAKPEPAAKAQGRPPPKSSPETNAEKPAKKPAAGGA